MIQKDSYYTLEIKTTEGQKVNIDVLDIVFSPTFQKQYIIYLLVGDPSDEIYASILNEKETTFSLDTIKTEEEINYIKSEIERVIQEFNEQSRGTL